MRCSTSILSPFSSPSGCTPSAEVAELKAENARLRSDLVNATQMVQTLQASFASEMLQVDAYRKRWLTARAAQLSAEARVKDLQILLEEAKAREQTQAESLSKWKNLGSQISRAATNFRDATRPSGITVSPEVRHTKRATIAASPWITDFGIPKQYRWDQQTSRLGNYSALDCLVPGAEDPADFPFWRHQNWDYGTDYYPWPFWVYITQSDVAGGLHSTFHGGHYPNNYGKKAGIAFRRLATRITSMVTFADTILPLITEFPADIPPGSGIPPPCTPPVSPQPRE